jgi:hypothetical protein
MWIKLVGEGGGVEREHKRGRMTLNEHMKVN